MADFVVVHLLLLLSIPAITVPTPRARWIYSIFPPGVGGRDTEAETEAGAEAGAETEAEGEA
jgi:hypothetical protein